MRNRSRRAQTSELNGGAGRLAAAISRHPREFVGIVMATAAIFAIFLNALFLQHGPHPAPIFATRSQTAQPVPDVLPRPRVAKPNAAPPASVRSQAEIVGDIQRELTHKGFYDGAADGIWGGKTDAAARDFLQAAGSKMSAEPNEILLRAIAAGNAKAPAGRAALPARSDAIAELIAPPKQVIAVQRALADFGYGQIRATGVLDSQTQSAIEKFERERRLPVTGQVSDGLMRELAAMTGRPLE